MKKILALILAASALLSLFACAKEEAETETAEKETVEETKIETEEAKTTEEAVVYDHKADQTDVRARLAAIPIANSSMTTDQLRQICADYIKLSVSFQWIPNQTFQYSESKVKMFYEGKLEGGIPYINAASGNLYRFLEYYDDETGVVNCDQIAKNPGLFGTACSGTAGWAWYRVVNSAKISYTHSMNVAHGFIPVGDYTYDTSKNLIWETIDGSRVYYYSTKDVCKENGRQKIYESYAKALLADCFSSDGHVRMAIELPVVIRNEDGTINGEKSYVVQAEQGLYNTSEHHTRYTGDGTAYQIRGNDGRAFTFKELYADGYLVHTFAEFLGTDPVEKGEATIPHSEPTATSSQIATGKLIANYPISDVITTVFDKDGNQKLRYVKRTGNHFTREMDLATTLPNSYIHTASKEEGCRILIQAQLGNGEMVTAYEGELVQ